jgi:hypothetical protein
MAEGMPQGRLIRYCGMDCSECDTYVRFLSGDAGGLVDPESQYRCCWLPKDYPEGRDCPIRTCCDEKGILLCGECGRLEVCETVQAFYAQPGYDKLRARMLAEVAGRRAGDGGDA